MERAEYEQACKTAADAQGVTRFVADLAAQGVAAEIHQTGGFTMAAYIPLECGYGVYANDEGATLYRKHGDQPEDECELIVTSGYGVVDSVAAFVKRWRDGLAAMRATRTRCEALRENPYQADAEHDSGWLYFGAYAVEDMGDGRCFVICDRSEYVGTLEECEACLWGDIVRHEGVA